MGEKTENIYRPPVTRLTRLIFIQRRIPLHSKGEILFHRKTVIKTKIKINIEHLFT